MGLGQKILASLIAFSFAATLKSGQTVAQSPILTTEELYKKVLPSIATLIVEMPNGQRSIGTAFMTIKEGLALTAWHVLEGGRKATLKFSDGEQFEVSGLVDRDELRDLALIRVKVFGRPLLKTEAAEPAIGSKAFVVGSPRGLEFSISDGLLSQIQTIAGMKQFQFTCPSSPGNSGGPLINAKGQVIGVVSWQLRDSQNLNFAMPVSYALGLDTTLPTRLLESVTSSGPALSLPNTGPNGHEKLNGSLLKSMVEELGYKVKVLNAEAGKEKYEIAFTKHDLDIPVALEISASKNYCWLTVFLGTAPKAPSDKFETLLKENFNCQPSFFYITAKGNLMMGIPMENRYISPANMKRNIEKLSDDVGKTKAIWL